MSESQPDGPVPKGSSSGMVALESLGKSLAAKLLSTPSLRIEDLLDIAEPDDRGWLLTQLIPAETAARRKRGEFPNQADYINRFPAYSEIIRTLFAELDSHSHSLANTVSIQPSSTSESARAADAIEIGSKSNQTRRSVGRYQLQSLLGSGGFAQVWLAQDPALDRTVAVKLSRPDKFPTVEVYQQILAEARRIAGLSLAGVVPVYDLVEEGGEFYIVSKYIDGGTLKEVLKERKFTPVESTKIIIHVAETLHKAHLKNIVHRDIKSSNILMDKEGLPWVSDFGLAISETEQMQEPRQVLGSFGYMSPEQARGESRLLDARTDIYSLGMVFYEMLTGRLAFNGTTVDDYQEQILKREPRPPRTIDENIPAELERICLKCLSKRIANRYSTASDLVADLKVWLYSVEPDLANSSANRLAPPQIAPTPISTERWLGMGAIGLLAILVGGIIYSQLPGPSPQVISGVPAAPTTSGNDSESSLPTPTVEANQFNWQKHWGLKARDIPFPGLRGVASMRYDNANYDAWEITSKYPRLVELGTIDERPHVISVGLTQPAWHGTIGLFFNYREELVGDKNPKLTGVCQIFALTQTRDEKGVARIAVLRDVVQISPTTGSIWPLEERGQVFVDWPMDDTVSRLEVTVSSAGISRATWAGRNLDELLPITRAVHQAPFATAGRFGLLHERDTSCFHRPRITVGKK